MHCGCCSIVITESFCSLLLQRFLDIQVFISVFLQNYVHYATLIVNFGKSMKISNFLFHLYVDYSSSNSLSPLWELSHMFDTPFFWTFLRFLSFFKLNTTHKECWSTVNSQSESFVGFVPRLWQGQFKIVSGEPPCVFLAGSLRLLSC